MNLISLVAFVKHSHAKQLIFPLTHRVFILADESPRKRSETGPHLLWLCERKIHTVKKNYRRGDIKNCVLHLSGRKAH